MSLPPAPGRPRPSRVARALIPLIGLIALTACGGSAASASKGDPVQVGLGAAKGTKTVQAGDKLKVTARGGVLTDVTVTDPMGRLLPGGLGDGGTVWTSSAKTTPDTKYSVVARTKNARGGTFDVKESLITAKADKLNKLVLNPGSQGATVGIAQPIMITFDFPVTDKAAVENHLKVTTSNHTTGSWGWVKDHSGKDRIDWRPKEYWKPGTTVTLRAELNGVDSGGGRYFAKDYDLTFGIGRSQVVKVDLDAKRLSFVENGEKIRSIPVSAGKPDAEHATWTGTFPLMAKEGTITMNSKTVGLGEPYDKTVRDAMKLTDSGTYAHAAPWNASDMGRINASSGCIGMTDSDADWLYGKIRVGDPFEITGSSVRGRADLSNGIGDWMVDWSRWLRNSALSSSS
ncbi:L,D-transpeptidase family protein [Streptomyces halobius]|uniref:Ig-like domain-containing protein n=1 Tax=Streptomyces halobius TaxID=2879846 RepID=A0ABY4M1R1_9ACTN|nr:Ig-like domain-containing protein [Streptomyces halobius]UQA91689.1 Ig-like domain-containing protein [Streptomyces halobius]